MKAWRHRRVSTRTVRWLVRGWLVSVGALLALAAVTANGAWRTIGAEQVVPDATPLRLPAAASASVVPLQPAAMPAPARGVTGTIALPDMPVPAVTGVDTAVIPARPFSLAGLQSTDRGRALECLTAAIYYEAASESDAGQAAVAQVVLNRVRHPAFPSSVCGVVYQGSERAGCQFSFACDGAMARVPSRRGWSRAMAVAAMALGGRVEPRVGLATHYHTYAVTPSWNRSLVLTDMIGAHLFHRWKGWWGTAPAFRQRYAGGEAVPGPHGRLVLPDAAPLEVTMPGAAPAPPIGRAPDADTDATLSAPTTAAADPLPDSGQVLDKWKDSGQPIR